MEYEKREKRSRTTFMIQTPTKSTIFSLFYFYSFFRKQNKKILKKKKKKDKEFMYCIGG